MTPELQNISCPRRCECASTIVRIGISLAETDDGSVFHLVLILWIASA